MASMRIAMAWQVVGLWMAVQLVLATAEDGTLPDESRMSYQQAFPSAGNFRLPTFMDVFASFSQKKYINVGLKWNVAESKAAMAYAVRLSAGHKPIALKTDDYHIEAFSKAKKGQASDFTKVRFRQKNTYSGSLGYAQPDSKKAGLFVLWDNKKKAYARLQLGSLLIMKNAVISGNLRVKGKIIDDDVISAKKNSDFAGTLVGVGSIGTRLEAKPGKGFALYTAPKGGKPKLKEPRFFVNDKGGIGMGTINPKAQLHIKAPAKAIALRIQSGKASIGGASVFDIDGSAKGKSLTGQRVRVLTNGNVGVNNPKPIEKLHVSGGVKVDSGSSLGPSKATLFVTNTLSKCTEHTLKVRDHLYVAACGRVGVKTAKPAADFHVTGSSKTTTLTVDKDAKVGGTTTLNKLTPLKGLLAANTLRIEKKAQLKGKVQMDDDVVIKGNLYVEKEVKMIGGGGGAEEMMSKMMSSRLALIEESHKTLHEHNKALHARVQELEAKLKAK
jgi:hypothetical protein